MRRATLALLLLALALPAAGAGDATQFPATYAGDTLRTGWYQTQPRLSPDVVAGGTFGQLFSTQLDGQVYAQPLVADGVLLAATETNHVYGLDPETGAIEWSRSLGAPWDPAPAMCKDLTPWVGITGTPVVDSGSGTAYVVAKTYAGNTAVFMAHAFDVRTGVERPGFPVRIAGTAENNPATVFQPKLELQRPGLLLLDGVVYAAFGGICDRAPYQGWIVGIGPDGHIRTMWVTRSGANHSGASIWQSGGALVSDGPGRILFATGNGGTSPPAPGSEPPADLGEAVVRAAVQPDGTIRAADWFSPYDAEALDEWDADLGSGAPVALPDSFGTPVHRHLLVQIGKQGYVYLLDRDDLGGRDQSAAGDDKVVQRLGPFGGVWAKPGVFGGGAGYVYIPTASGGTKSGGTVGELDVYRSSVDGAGNPSLARVATADDAWGFGSSAGVVTSVGDDPGTALLWAVWSPDGGGAGAQLRAYDAVPTAGSLRLRFSAPVGTASKFALPGVGDGRIYVGTRNGRVLGFGAPVSTALAVPPLTFPPTTVGLTSTLDATLTALQPVTVTAVASSTDAFAAGSPDLPLPATLAPGDELHVPVTFTPGAPGLAGGSLHVQTSTGGAELGLSGIGRSVEPQLSSSPPALSFGAVRLGGSAAATFTLSNDGGSPLQVTSLDPPDAPFSMQGAPAPGAQIGAGDAITVTVVFSPEQEGAATAELGIETTGGEAQLGLSGIGAAPPRLNLSATALDFGSVPLGSSTTRGFSLTNTGGSTLTITKSKPPALGRFVAATELPEGTTIAPGRTVREIVRFTPGSLAAATDGWTITGDDGSGLHVVTFGGRGAAPKPPAPPPVRPKPAPPESPPRASLPAGLRRLGELPHRPIPGD